MATTKQKNYVELSEWRLRSGLARSIANALWHGDAHAVRTNRAGVFYFSCAGHGGYVIDPQVLDEHEAVALRELLPSVTVNLCVQEIDGVDTVIGQRFEGRAGVRYNTNYPYPRWVEREVLVAEEDCDWAYVEALTDIRTADPVFADETPERRDFLILKSALRMVRSSLEWERRRAS